MPSSLNGTGVTFNDGTTLQSGNIPTANLGSGTANNTTFLRGDRTWGIVQSDPSVTIVNTQIFTTSGTWTKPSGFSATDTVLVLCIGAGGSGGAAFRSSGEAYVRGGGGGGVLYAAIPYGDASASYSVTVGAGGAARVNSTNNTGLGGFSGGNSSFGSLFIAEGGLGGAAFRGTSTTDNSLPENDTSGSRIFIAGGIGTNTAVRAAPRTGSQSSGAGFNVPSNQSLPGYGFTGCGGGALYWSAVAFTGDFPAGVNRLFGSGGAKGENTNGGNATGLGSGGGGAIRGTTTTSGAGTRGEVRVYVIRGQIAGDAFFNWGLGV
jgi:hypothetical protein